MAPFSSLTAATTAASPACSIQLSSDGVADGSRCSTIAGAYSQTRGPDRLCPRSEGCSHPGACVAASGAVSVVGGLLRSGGAGYERSHDVAGVAVEVMACPVVAGCGPWVGVAGGDLYVPQRHPCVQRSRDE